MTYKTAFTMPIRHLTELRSSRRRTATAVLAGTTGCLLVAFAAFSAPASAAQAPVLLATTGSYSVLGASTVTNTGPTTLSGDYGVSPGTAITGFPPGTSGGVRHATDAPAAQAKSDLATAYNDAASRASSAAVAGDLVGKTLISGVYTSSGPLAISGTVTFDGQGDPTSVFIVQIAKTLITATASHVATINGAQACNIFWQVGSSATLGTASTFQGTIMALASVTVTTSAHVKGRALARTGAVTLDNDVFTSPDCGNNTVPTSATATTTTLTTSPTTANTGGTIGLSAVVSSPTGTPTGTVSFVENGVILGTSPVGPTGHASLQVPAGGTARSGTISAVFNGSPTQAPSTSGPAAFRVVALVVPPTAAELAAASAAANQVVVEAATASQSAAAAATAAQLAATGTPHVAVMVTSGVGLLALGFSFVWFSRRRPVVVAYLKRH
ncbi:ice-binding family protein [Jatrophihabitans sp. DSM 45814]